MHAERHQKTHNRLVEAVFICLAIRVMGGAEALEVVAAPIEKQKQHFAILIVQYPEACRKQPGAPRLLRCLLFSRSQEPRACKCLRASGKVLKEGNDALSHHRVNKFCFRS